MANHGDHPSVLSEDDFVSMFETLGPHRMASTLKINVRSIYRRRANLERKQRRQITIAAPNSTRHNISHPGRIKTELRDGIVIVGSDGHYWPGPPSTAHRAFVKFCKDLKPGIVVMNGDAFDGSRISRHPSIMWEKNPSVADEIEAVKERLGEIEAAAFKAKKFWPLGNHDGRFETRLATVAPEYANTHGFHLKDHLPLWEPCWSVWLNDEIVIKHRNRGGIHATHNNTLNAGKTIITSHLHSLKVTPFSDYNGTRWGVDTGCIADPYGGQFQDYTEDNTRNHRSGFIVLTFRGGRLMWPEVVSVVDGERVDFREELITV